MKNFAFYSVLLFVLGAALGTGITYAVKSNGAHTETSQTDSMAGMDHSGISMGSMSMDDMMKELDGKTGDAFDKAFLSMMIEHHQGAIDMTNVAKTSAKHDEIKTMADDIISAQTREIKQMEDWQDQWGY